jgi:signal transduction histidine kinase
MYNAATLDLLNTNQSIADQDFSKIMPLTDSGGKVVDLFNLTKGENRTIERTDLRFTPRSEKEVMLDVTITPVHSVEVDHRRWGGYTVVCRDITKQREVEEEKDEFIAVTSHELRTPLAIAEANLSTALVPGIAKMDAKATEMVKQARENVLFLIDLVKDLTTLSRAERGMSDTFLSEFSLDDVADEMCRDYTNHAKDKGLKLLHHTVGKPRLVYTSRSELQEVIQNLVINAIKYTEKGEVVIDTDYCEVSAKISVRDTGIGIPLTEQGKIFAKFFRSEDGRVRSANGTGLGLYISRKLADHLGLNLDFVSVPDEGSTFSVTIPYRDAP